MDYDAISEATRLDVTIVVITQALIGIPAAIRQRVAHRDHFKKAAFIGLLGWYHHKQFTGGCGSAPKGDPAKTPTNVLNQLT